MGVTRGSPAGVMAPFSTISTISTNRDVSLFFKYRQRDSCVE